ncbi:AraC family transcriptional regulator [Ferrimonas aestuarii]|uniref:AraC family transcriptional regulator n=1 Tax=Ferrimonas aestuarii TaxID=2569539 RepID=A0A4U1BJN3_9GAMM|nr:AraC family transcriptional regulator [Ferrimonas aestuarii]TKB51777.1 AraC family transcriptional regulator [Ferrimonas aestuarii]
MTSLRRIAGFQSKCIDSQLLPATLLQLFQQRGLDQEQLLRGTKLFATDIEAGAAISSEQLLKLLLRAQQMWPGPDLAFALAQHWLGSQSGPLTNGLVCAPTLGHALALWHRYHWLTQPWLNLRHWRCDDTEHWLINIDLGLEPIAPLLMELCCASLTATLKRLGLASVDWQFGFPHRRPNHWHQYDKYLGGQLQFEFPAFKLSLSRQALSRPLPMADATAYQLAWQQTRRALTQQPLRHGLPATIRHRLYQQPGLTLPEMALHLQTSPATLKRRLSQHHTSYQKLQDQARLNQALYLLTKEGACNRDIAHKLQFADVGNFRRSFKRWTGFLPSQLIHN